ncbi:MAG TPA: hypothetical protein VE944_05225 [Nostoc sp.]|nr:hypothetical protein [Nostoc sp.]
MALQSVEVNISQRITYSNCDFELLPWWATEYSWLLVMGADERKSGDGVRKI